MSDLKQLQSFIFGKGTENETYESLQQKRRMAEAMAKTAKPTNFGEGLSYLGQAIASRRLDNQAKAGEEKGRGEFTSVFQKLMGGQTGTPFNAPTNSGYDTFNASLSNTESGGDYNVTNSEGFGGKYQFGQPRLDDFNRANGVAYKVSDLTAGTDEAKALTEAVQNWHVGDIDNYVTQNGLDKYIGQNVGGVTITQDGLRGMAHLGGKGGMGKFLQTGGQYNPADSNGTSLSDYAQTHGGASRGASGGGMGGVNPALIEALSSPYANAGEKAILNMMLQNQMTANKPMSPLQVLQIKKLEKELGAKPERKVIKGADGYNYYQDTNERVLPGVEQDEKEPKIQKIKQADGSEVVVQYDHETGSFVPAKVPEGGTAVGNRKVKLTENQSKLTLFKTLQDATSGFIDKLEESYNPANLRDRAAAAIPYGNFIKTKEGQKYDTAASQWAEGALRISTGAAATQPEIERTRSTYFPEAGDGPETIALKSDLRKSFAEALEASLGDPSGATKLPDPRTYAVDYNITSGANSAFSGSNGDMPPPPDGIDAKDWEFMTPEERALFQ